MLKDGNPDQIQLDYQMPFSEDLNPNNRWIKLAHLIPWNEFKKIYYDRMDNKKGRPAKDARVVIGALIVKHMQGLSDEETIQTIKENPYIQYFLGYSKFQYDKPFEPSLFVAIRKRLGLETLNSMNEKFIEKFKELEKSINQDTEVKDNSKKKAENEQNKGKIIVDATVIPSDIQYPTDIRLLNKARESTEEMVDILWEYDDIESRKPRTYRENAREDFLKVEKQKRPRKSKLKKAIKKQLQYLRRDIKHVEEMQERRDKDDILPDSLKKKFKTIKKLYSQQKEMYDEDKNRVNDRIVSIHQPQIRPIVRGKARQQVEFGPKITLSIVDGFSYLDYFSWDNYHEGNELMESIDKYKRREGYYPEVAIADNIYGTRANRRKLKKRDIRYSGKPLGRPPKKNSKQYKRRKKRLKRESKERNAIEGKFGEGKRGYNMGLIKTQTAETSETWVGMNVLVMNIAKAFRKLEQFFIFQIYFNLNTGNIAIFIFTIKFDENYKIN